MPPTLEAIIFVTDPPEFLIEDGLVHISQQVGQTRIDRVMRYNTFLKTIAHAQQAVREYERRGIAEVIPFPRRNGTH